MCGCGFTAATAVDMHRHLTAASSDRSGQHFLKSSFGIANRNAPQQQEQPARHGSSSNGNGSKAAAAGSGSSTPNSLYGFTPVSPVRSSHGDDVINQAWEAVEQFNSGPNPAAAAAAAAAGQHASRSNKQQQQQQQRYPAITPAAAHGSSHSEQRQGASRDPTTAGVAAAVQFAAGVGLGEGTKQQPSAATARRLSGTHAAGHDSGEGHRHQQQHQQQQQQWSDIIGAQGALGVQLVAGNSSLMAAVGGWVVNQAIDAAVDTATAAVAGAGAPASGSTAPPPPAAAAAAAAMAAGSSGSGSWWRRFSSRAEAHTDPAAPAAAAADAGKKHTSKGLTAAAKRHGLRKKASVAAATAAAGGHVHGLVGSDDGEGSVGVCGSDSGPEGARSDGSTEYSQLLAEMDQELRSAAAAGAAAAVRGGGTRATSSSDGMRRSSKAGAAGAAAGHAAAGGVFQEVDLDEEAEEQQEGAAGAAVMAPGGGWLAAMGLVRSSTSSLAARAGSSSGGGGADDSYEIVSHDTGPDLAHRARVVRGVLLWRTPSSSAKALALGLYVILLLGSIPRALDYMQVTTVLPGVALLYLTYNMAKPWVIRLYCSCLSPSSRPEQLQARLLRAEEAGARAVVWAAARVAVEAGSWALALLALSHRALRARRFTTSCWTFVALWLLLLVSELRVINQTLLAMIAYAGLFCVPWLYQQFRTAIDGVVYDTLHFVALLVVHAERWAYAAALLAAALTWQLLEPGSDAAGSGASLVVRCTAAGLAGLAVLLWRVVVWE